MSEMKRYFQDGPEMTEAQHPEYWADTELFYRCSEADEVIAELRRVSLACPRDMVDYGIEMLSEKLAARDKTIEKLAELVREAWDFPNDDMPQCTWADSTLKKRLDSIPGPHSDPPATAAPPKD